MSVATSLGGRLSAWLALQGFASMAAICALVYFDARTSLIARQTEALTNKRTQIEHLVAELRSSDRTGSLKHALDDYFVGHREVALRIVDAADQPVYASEPLVPPIRTGRTTEFTLPAGGDAAAGRMTASLVLDTNDDDLLLRRLGSTLLVAAVGGALLSALAGFLLVRRGLRPVRSLAEQARALAADTLHKRLGIADQPEELHPLVEQFNALLGRLSAAYSQLQAFNSDVAHELCTPLATLISSCELALRRQRSGAEMLDVIGSNLEELRRLTGIVQDMLFLSGADRGARARRVEVRSLAEVARIVCEYHDAAIQAARLHAAVNGDASGAFDVPLLQRALSNLLLNAARHAHPGSTVTVEIAGGEEAGPVRMSVRNVGAKIPEADLPRIFDRFFRSDRGRADSDLHHGLGLAIVAAIARMHDGCTFASSNDSGTEVGVLLRQGPASDAKPAPLADAGFSCENQAVDSR